MVEANFLQVFIGIETPSAEALKESRKFQNLRRDNLEQIRRIQQRGLWVTGGFIVGFDADDETIFERQREFVDRTAIAWAMIGLLQAPPSTAFFDRVKKERRLLEEILGTTNFSPPDFRTALPLPILLRGFATLLGQLYDPDPFFRRALHSLEALRPHAHGPGAARVLLVGRQDPERPFPPPALPGLNGTVTLSDFRADRHPDDDVGGATSARPGSPPITQITFPACRAQYPGGPDRCLSVSSLPHGLPRLTGGSASTTSLSRPA